MKRRSFFWVSLGRFAKNKLALLGVAMVIAFALAGAAHPILMSTVWDRATYHPSYGHDDIETEFVIVENITDPATEIDLMTARLSNPFYQVGDIHTAVTFPPPFTKKHILGVDNLGRDVLSMVLAATRPSFIVGLSAGISTAIVGLIFSKIAATFRRWVDTILSNVSDALLVLPAPLLMVILGAGPFRAQLGPVVFGLIYGLVMGAGAAAVVMRSQALSVLAKPFIDAAAVAGANRYQIIKNHLLPHLVPIAALYLLLGVSGAIVADGFVSFLGFSDTRLNWGTIIFFALALPPANRAGIPWEALVSAAGAITLFSAAFYMIGLGVRDIAKPHNNRS
jgi:ABC-type dipeptide/oligopeptide/nickel transport system permease subunit